MSAKLSFKYDREAGILHIDTCQPHPEQESEELGDEVVARLNPKTGEIENLEVMFFVKSEDGRNGERNQPTGAEIPGCR